MPRIVLIGMPGAGKTTIGKSLALALSLPFIDADRELIARTGVPIATIFEIEGEAGFRRREAALIADLLERKGLVMATGGGAILSPVTRQLMRESAIVVYLRATLTALIERTQRDSSRPLLANGNLKEKLTAMLAIREPLYEETAHLTFDTGRQSPAKLAGAIARTIETRTGDPAK
ncbi:MAG: shikimate kinase [Betaproteobacteria bacterium]|nr:shikimate kinase [Betaproteobacteria bacterium]